MRPSIILPERNKLVNFVAGSHFARGSISKPATADAPSSKKIYIYLSFICEKFIKLCQVVAVWCALL